MKRRAANRGHALFVAVLPGKAGETNLFILAITSQPPQAERLAIRIPDIELRRAGLDNLPLWIIVDEYNHDILESSTYFEPNAQIGAFSPAFHKSVMRLFTQCLRSRAAKAVPRFE